MDKQNNSPAWYISKIAVVILLANYVVFCCCSGGDKYDTVKHYDEKMFDRALNTSNKGMLDQAFKMVDSGYSTFPYISIADRFRYYSFKQDAYASFYSPVYNVDSCLGYADSMVLLLIVNHKEKLMPREYAMANSRKGHIYLDKRNYTEAFNYISLSKLIVNDIHDTLLMAEYDYTIALVFYRQSKFAEAASYYKKALLEIDNTALTSNKYHQVQMWQDDLGLCYYYIGLYDSAITYFAKDTTYIINNSSIYRSVEPNFPEIALGVVYGMLAQTLEAKGEYNEAEKYYKKAVNINSREGFDNTLAILHKMLLAGLYIKQHTAPAAMALLSEVKPVLQQKDDRRRLFYKQIMWQYYSAFGTPLQMNVSYNDYLLYKDSVDAKNKNVENVNVDVALTQLKKDYDIKLLQKDNAKKNMYLVVASLLGLMAIAILVLIFKNYRQGKSHIAELQELNLIIKMRNGYLQKTLSTLEKSQEDNTMMLKIIAHDLRNPVGGMAALADVMLHEKNFTTAQVKNLGIIKTAGLQCMNLIEDILHVNTGIADIDSKPVNMQALLQYTTAMLQFNATKKNQQILLEAQQVVIAGDEDKLSRVFSNLVSNAIKFSLADSKIEVRLYTKDNNAVISVADNGIGIPEDILNKLFDMSEDKRRRGTAGEPSFGFGLAICKQIIDAHGGSISVESETGKGTTFYVRLPLVG